MITRTSRWKGPELAALRVAYESTERMVASIAADFHTSPGHVCRLVKRHGWKRRGYERLTALAGLDLPAGSSWILTRLARQGPVRSEDLAAQANVTLDYGKPFVDRLVAEDMVVRSDGTLVLTDAGHAAAEQLFAARRAGLRELLADWSPEEYAELGELLTKLSRELLGADADRNLIDSAVQEEQRGSQGRHRRAMP